MGSEVYNNQLLMNNSQAEIIISSKMEVFHVFLLSFKKQASDLFFTFNSLILQHYKGSCWPAVAFM